MIVKCTRCGIKNRVERKSSRLRPVCGRCGAPLETAARGAVIQVTDQVFQNEVLSEAGPVLVDCWTPWCGPCRMMGPVMNELAARYAGRLKVAKLNVDENPKTASAYAVRSIPTLLFFKNGQLKHTAAGALPGHEIEKNLAAIL